MPLPPQTGAIGLAALDYLVLLGYLCAVIGHEIGSISSRRRPKPLKSVSLG